MVQKVESLKYKSDGPGPKPGPPAFAERSKVLTCQENLTLVRSLKAGNNVQQRRLAGSRTPGQTDHLPSRDGEVDTAEHRPERTRPPESSVYAGKLNEYVGCHCLIMRDFGLLAEVPPWILET